ncbi:hypothetical protein [Oscillibacter sp.]|uniref:hypothetical protein n=1 Tax=Oscillibacter sp. TaxID=1945593 RepID=UPI0028AC64F8|nr:hypothetical protein [Oscillibacter sp.]
MSNEQKFEIIKALAYGRTAEEIASAEDIAFQDVMDVQMQNGTAIANERAALKEGGFLDGNAD